MTATPRQDERKRTGDIIGGHYRVVDVLGEGGMGVVYKVEDLRLDRRLRALKMILPERLIDVSATERFRQEAKALTSLTSEFILEIMDANVDEGAQEAFFVTELLEGRTLEDLLRERGPLDRVLVVRLLHQVALALETMHANGIAHRDLKPANLFLLKRFDGSISVKVVDFGIAKFINPNRATTAIAGSRGYMAPEQAAGIGVDHRADIFAFGRLASEMLLGAVSSDATDHQTMSAPQAFTAWLNKAIALNPQERYASASEAIQQLADALEVPLMSSSTTWDSLPPRSGMASVSKSSTRRSLPRRWLVAAGVLAVGAVSAVVWLRSSTEGEGERGPTSAAPLPARERTPPEQESLALGGFSAVAASGNAMPLAPAPEVASAPPAPATNVARATLRPRNSNPTSRLRAASPVAAPPRSAASLAVSSSLQKSPSRPKRPVF